MRPFLSLVVAACLFACCDKPSYACPPVIIDQPVQVQSFSHVQQFAAPVVVQSVPVQTFAVNAFAVPVHQVAIVRQRNVCVSNSCGAAVRVRAFGGGRSVSRQRSVVRSR